MHMLILAVPQILITSAKVRILTQILPIVGGFRQILTFTEKLFENFKTMVSTCIRKSTILYLNLDYCLLIKKVVRCMGMVSPKVLSIERLIFKY